LDKEKENIIASIKGKGKSRGIAINAGWPKVFAAFIKKYKEILYLGKKLILFFGISNSNKIAYLS
jgi:hypothetical protein